MNKTCNKCELEKEQEDFVPVYKNGEIVRYRNTCKKCFNKAREERRKETPSEARLEARRIRDKKRQYAEGYMNWRMKYQYDLSLEEFNSMHKEQEGLCKICNKPESNPRNKRLSIDHCHSSGRVRGLLCSNCNTAIGLLKDDVDILQKAINYLQKDLDNTL